MNAYSKKAEIRWSDIDSNFHVLHSKYYDFAAFCRMSFLTEHGVTPEKMMEWHIGPILFREECVFKKEIRYGDEITITLWLDKVSLDHRKWTFINEIFINGDTLAAVVTVDGAWMDIKLRKVAVPPDDFKIGIEQMPKTENFKQQHSTDLPR